MVAQVEGDIGDVVEERIDAFDEVGERLVRAGTALRVQGFDAKGAAQVDVPFKSQWRYGPSARTSRSGRGHSTLLLHRGGRKFFADVAVNAHFVGEHIGGGEAGGGGGLGVDEAVAEVVAEVGGGYAFHGRLLSGGLCGECMR